MNERRARACSHTHIIIIYTLTHTQMEHKRTTAEREREVIDDDDRILCKFCNRIKTKINLCYLLNTVRPLISLAFVRSFNFLISWSLLDFKSTKFTRALSLAESQTTGKKDRKNRARFVCVCVTLCDIFVTLFGLENAKFHITQKRP